MNEQSKKNDDIVLEAICRLGGIMKMRVMDFRKHLSEPLKEVQIKKSLKRLTEKGLIEVLNISHTNRGNEYRVTTEAL